MKKTVMLVILTGIFAQASGSNTLFATAGFPELVGVGYERYNVKFSFGTMPKSYPEYNLRPYSAVFTVHQNLVERNALRVRASIVSAYIYCLRYSRSTQSGLLKSRDDAITIGPRISIGAGNKKIFGEIGAGLNFYMERTLYGDLMSQSLAISTRGLFSFGVSVGYVY